MGRVRDWNFDAVIGVGGKRPWARDEEIAKKINWIGIGASKIKARKPNWNGPLVIFERFVLFDGKGPELKRLAPKLFKYMFEDQHVRAVLSQSLPKGLQNEITTVLELVKKQKKKRQFYSGTILTESKCCGRKTARPNC
jgi:hypothetical protein